MQKAWDEAGLERRTPIFYEQTPKHVIRFERINREHATLLIRRYLNEYRINQSHPDSLEPFTEEAIAKIAELSELNASEILKRAYESLERASDQGVKQIEANFVVANDDVSLAERKQPPGIHEAPTTNLLDKAK